MEFVTQEDDTRSFVGLKQVGDGDSSRAVCSVSSMAKPSTASEMEPNNQLQTQQSTCSHVRVRGSGAGAVMRASKPNLPHMAQKKEDHLLKLVAYRCSVIGTCDLTLTVA
jgi:hypothetical protein